jgi:hypothetical protein
MREFNNGKVDIWLKSEAKDLYCITIKNDPRLARALNAVLGHYPKGTTFYLNDEPTFPFFGRQIEGISRCTPYMAKIIAQISSEGHSSRLAPGNEDSV